ncbi:MAG TPA: CIA30 family protein [Blastocatellia bacterium]|nr:CIA30 family protein [Blastocatellia bacterium]
MSKYLRRSMAGCCALAGAAVVAIPLLSLTSTSARQSGRAIVIKNVRIFDGSAVTPSGSVILEGGKIKSVGKTVAAPDGAEIIDGTGHTLLPGLIDAHTHAYGAALKQAVVFGVTTELDMFTDHRTAAQMRKEQAEGRAADRADLFSAGTLVTAPGGHGTEYGMKIPTITNPDESQAFVDARIAEGSDYIKIVYDDAKAFGLNFPTVSKETMAAVIASAHKRGKLAVVHISTLEGARDAIKAGADGLVHIFIDRATDPEFTRLVADRRAFVIPTLTVNESVTGAASGASLVTDPAFANALSHTDAVDLKKSFPTHPGARLSYATAEAAVRQLKAARIPILAGTDAPNPGTLHGASIHRELELLVKAGLTPIEALAAATSEPAAQFRLSDRGRIEPGRRADLLLVKGDPTADIKVTRNIARVWKGGVAVDRQAYIASIEKMNAEAERLRKQPAPAGSESGLVSDFEEEKVSAKFGSGWSVSTDAMAGGKSSAEMKMEPEGSQGSRGSLLITGEISPDLPYAWAGAMFSPGATMMAPANLSSKDEISFWAKGDGKTCRLMLFARSQGFQPAIKSFATGPEWKRFSFRISEFGGMDGSDLMGILFAGGPAPGRFVLQIDNVVLSKSK